MKNKGMHSIIYIILFIGMCVFLGVAVFYHGSNSTKNITCKQNVELEVTSKSGILYYTENNEELIKDVGLGNDNSLNKLGAFKPGDVIEMSLSIRNVGAASAYVRETASLIVSPKQDRILSEAGMVQIYRSNSKIDINQIKNIGATSSKIISSSLFGVTKYNTSPYIFNGSTKYNNYEVEGEGIDTINKAHTIYYYIYLDKDAPDDYGVIDIDFNVRIDAVKYRDEQTFAWGKSNTITMSFIS